MSSQRILAAAYMMDWIVGDPEWFPHPVRWIGKSIKVGEQILRRPNQGPSTEFIAGGALSLGIVATTYLITAQTLRGIHRRSALLGCTAEVLFAWTCLASRNLHDEASAVVDSLERNDIALARQRLARIVGRDTQDLDVQEISRAVIETIAESCSDGVIAPLFYMAIGGVPLALAYKAINTLDSMIGHTDPRYLYYGKLAARLDDAANLLPSRLTALGITTIAALMKDTSSTSALAVWLRDGMKHKSPNAGQPESAMSGALQVSLGGENFYDCELMTTPFIGAEFPAASVQTAKQAIRIAAAVSVLGFIAALLLRRRR
jgi:adenosylcobinamide-phosphate synthase